MPKIYVKASSPVYAKDENDKKNLKSKSIKQLKTDDDKMNSKKIAEIAEKEGNLLTGETFYLIKNVKKMFSESETKRNIEMEKFNRLCNKEEEKDKKYIEALKNELLDRYKAERDRCQEKIKALREKALKKIEQQAQKEQEKIEAMCKIEVLAAVNKFAEAEGWFKTAVLLYNANPEFFNNKKK